MMKKQTVLIIDDDHDFAYLLKRCLKKAPRIGEIHVAHNGQEALTYFNGHVPPDITLVDINMPVMNGFEFLAALPPLLATELESAPVFHVISSSNSEIDRRQAAGFGQVQSYFVKPVLCEDFLKGIGVT